MLKERKYDFDSTTVLDSSPSIVYTYTIPSCRIVSLKIKFMVYNIDQDRYNILHHTFCYIHDNVTPAGVNVGPSINYNDESGSLDIDVEYIQSTNTVRFSITNIGSYSPEIACNWLIDMEVFTD